jgi:two-component system, NtrC family, sensor kinase
VATQEMNSDTIEAQRREIESLKSELEHAHEQLVEAERLASLGEMAAGMAHEIRNPLDLVNNFAALNVELLFELDEALANEEDVGELVSDLKRNTAAVAHHASRADSIVGALMQHAGSGRGRHEPTDVNAFVDRFLRVSYQSRLSMHDNFHCDVERDYGDGVGEMLLNRLEMGRVLLNILGNAFDATEELAARRGRDYTPRVKVSTRRDDGFVEIRVSDNGPGIPPEVRKKVFEPFFTTKQGGAGTGLGLSVSYDIVTGAHKGALSVEGAEGEGATIVIRLPWLQEPD